MTCLNDWILFHSIRTYDSISETAKRHVRHFQVELWLITGYRDISWWVCQEQWALVRLCVPLDSTAASAALRSRSTHGDSTMVVMVSKGEPAMETSLGTWRCTCTATLVSFPAPAHLLQSVIAGRATSQWASGQRNAVNHLLNFLEAEILIGVEYCFSPRFRFSPLVSWEFHLVRYQFLF